MVVGMFHKWTSSQNAEMQQRVTQMLTNVASDMSTFSQEFPGSKDGCSPSVPYALLSGLQRDMSKSEVRQLVSWRGSSGQLCCWLSRRLMSKTSAALLQSSRLQRDRKRRVVIIAVIKHCNCMLPTCIVPLCWFTFCLYSHVYIHIIRNPHQYAFFYVTQQCFYVCLRPTVCLACIGLKQCKGTNGPTRMVRKLNGA